MDSHDAMRAQPPLVLACSVFLSGTRNLPASRTADTRFCSAELEAWAVVAWLWHKPLCLVDQGNQIRLQGWDRRPMDDSVCIQRQGESAQLATAWTIGLAFLGSAQ